MKPNIVLFDLDGTLANIAHRRPLVECEPKRWREFYAACEADLVAILSQKRSTPTGLLAMRYGLSPVARTRFVDRPRLGLERTACGPTAFLCALRTTINPTIS